MLKKHLKEIEKEIEINSGKIQLPYKTVVKEKKNNKQLIMKIRQILIKKKI